MSPSMDQVAQQLQDWIRAFDTDIVVVNDAPDWDWKWFEQLLLHKRVWPEKLNRQPLLYCPDDAEMDALAEKNRWSRHHALNDAMLLCISHQLYRG